MFLSCFLRRCSFAGVSLFMKPLAARGSGTSRLGRLMSRRPLASLGIRVCLPVWLSLFRRFLRPLLCSMSD